MHALSCRVEGTLTGADGSFELIKAGATDEIAPVATRDFFPDFGRSITCTVALVSSLVVLPLSLPCADYCVGSGPTILVQEDFGRGGIR